MESAMGISLPSEPQIARRKLRTYSNKTRNLKLAAVGNAPEPNLIRRNSFNAQLQKSLWPTNTAHARPSRMYSCRVLQRSQSHPPFSSILAQGSVDTPDVNETKLEPESDVPGLDEFRFDEWRRASNASTGLKYSLRKAREVPSTAWMTFNECEKTNGTRDAHTQATKTSDEGARDQEQERDQQVVQDHEFRQSKVFGSLAHAEPGHVRSGDLQQSSAPELRDTFPSTGQAYSKSEDPRTIAKQIATTSTSPIHQRNRKVPIKFGFPGKPYPRRQHLIFDKTPPRGYKVLTYPISESKINMAITPNYQPGDGFSNEEAYPMSLFMSIKRKKPLLASGTPGVLKQLDFTQGTGYAVHMARETTQSPKPDGQRATKRLRSSRNVDECSFLPQSKDEDKMKEIHATLKSTQDKGIRAVSA